VPFGITYSRPARIDMAMDVSKLFLYLGKWRISFKNCDKLSRPLILTSN